MPKKTLGTMLQDCYEDALTDWVGEFAGSRKLPDVYAEKIKESSITAQFKRAGRANIQVTIVAEKPWQNIVCMFRYVHKGGDWIRVRSTTGSNQRK